MDRCDVLIVGAGPAGCSAAYHLSKLGVGNVTVIERMPEHRYERYHRTCGEAVSDSMLSSSGMPDGYGIRRVTRIRMSHKDVRIEIPVRGWIIDRNALLKGILEESGARVVQDSVVAIERTEEGFLIRCKGGEHLCRYLIGADGAFSVVRKQIFGTSPEIRFPAVNNIVESDDVDDALGFEISERYPGAYRWDFPSASGTRSIGYLAGTDDVPDPKERGIRYIVAGRSRRVVEGCCCIVGDAAMLANALCYGGIGVALLTGRKAAEAIAAGDLNRYSRWVSRSSLFDHHYMDAEETFMSWKEADIDDAVRPFKGGYSVLRGLYAMLRRPGWANVYISIWMAFRHGW